MIRLLAAGAAGIALIFCLWQGGRYLAQPASTAAAMAETLAGERWYSLTLDAKHLGYWRTENHRDSEGNWVFESEQRFAMDASDPVSTRARRVFSREPPHRLLRAEQVRQRRDDLDGVRIEALENGYRTIPLPEGSAPGRRADWHYSMADYLAFELWLTSERPRPGSTRSVLSLDFERTDLVYRAFDVVDLNERGYLVESAAPRSATRIQLDEALVPEELDIAGLFSLRRASRGEALAPRSTLQSASYYIPADRRLRRHTRLSRLILGIEGHPAPGELFAPVERVNGIWRLTLAAGHLSGGGAGADHLAPTLHIPAGHPEIAALAGRVVRGLDGDLARARALNRFVHEYLTYRPGMPLRGVLTLLEDQRGDCTEFADLLTTLARSVGIPGRTVFGLAYDDGERPAFAYHAWNELMVDGAWQAMDPTWGQDEVDATHIPLPEDEAAALTLLTGSVRLAFSVLEAAHFPD